MPNHNDDSVFQRHESAVRLYCRKFPAVFARARGSWIYAENGDRYLDFFCGAGSLNYGHNPEAATSRMIEYLRTDGIMHALDMHTTTKRQFIQKLHDIVLAPLGRPYRIQFTGPTGTDAVEAALKLARRVTGRRTVVAFTGAFHGMSNGSLHVTGSLHARAAGSVSVHDVMFVPYEIGPGGHFDSIGFLRRITSDPAGGVGVPAAVIVEPVQIDGGVYPASAGWLRDLRKWTTENGVVLICDDIQAGCGRTGEFFSFMEAGIQPDVVTLSKSVGGSGLPLSLVLIADDLDVWSPGEHTGTFRGNQLAFVSGATMLEQWRDPEFLDDLAERSHRLQEFGAALLAVDATLSVRGRGMLLGIDTSGCGPDAADRTEAIQRHCFENGLILELCGRAESVVKLMPPLTIRPDELALGLDIVREAVDKTR